MSLAQAGLIEVRNGPTYPRQSSVASKRSGSVASSSFGVKLREANSEAYGRAIVNGVFRLGVLLYWDVGGAVRLDKEQSNSQ